MANKSKVHSPMISDLLKPISASKVDDRKVWSVPMNGVWLPFFMATNTTGNTAISADVLGAPLRLQREKDGTPKLSSSGKPVVRVVKELNDQVKLVRENFMAGLVHYAHTVQKEMPQEYNSQAKAAREAGDPIIQKDMADLTAYMKALAELANCAARDAATEPEPEQVAATEPERERELVAA